MLLIYGEEAAWESRSAEERGALLREYSRLSSGLRAQERLVSAGELQPVATATTVRVRDRDTLVGDGPFAETKEVLGGYFLVEAETLDEAIEWAARIPGARDGTVEIRPVVDHAGGAP
jgi:hypothetical protein